jgi:hypothetical protein
MFSSPVSALTKMVWAFWTLRADLNKFARICEAVKSGFILINMIYQFFHNKHVYAHVAQSELRVLLATL